MTPSIDAVLIMGVSGCGKSSVGEALCLRNGAFAIEGDSFHPAANIEKMSAGIPLTDEDRAGWLDTLAAELQKAIAAGQRPVLTCSALKLIYRERLRRAVPGLGVVFLELTRDAAAERVATRPGHFMPASLIDSQFADLQPLEPDEAGITLDGTEDVSRLVAAAREFLEREAHGRARA